MRDAEPASYTRGVQQSERPVLRSRVWPLACGALTGVLLLASVFGIDQPLTAWVVACTAAACAVGVLGWALVRSRRLRREHEEELTDWAAERAAQSERLRIARELHDLASHGLGLITLRAASARRVGSPEGALERERALADIEQAARDATIELRRMLTVLRTPGEGEAPLRPAQTFEDLAAITEAAERSGVAATLTTGGLADVSAGTQVTVADIVREALANTARHAGPVPAQVTVTRHRGAVVVTVDDDGAAPGWEPTPGSGHGLTGLRERVAALGGQMEAGKHGGGFRVRAWLPDRVGR